MTALLRGLPFVHNGRLLLLPLLVAASLVLVAPFGAASTPGRALADAGDAGSASSDLNDGSGGPAPASPIVLGKLETEMLSALNAQRQQAGLPATLSDDLLVRVARVRSADMAGKNYFSHTAPDGTTAITLLHANGVYPPAAGEILGRTNGPDEGSVDLVIAAFMNSPPHRSSILSERYSRVGVGTAIGAGNMKYFAIVFTGD